MKRYTPAKQATDSHIKACVAAWRATNGLEPALIVVRRTAQGKPFLADTDLFVSVSHSQTHICVGVANRPFGLDIEPYDRVIRQAQAISRRWFSTAEQKQLAEADDPNALFLKLWVKKEAWLKHRGTGLVDLALADTTRLPGHFYTFCVARHYLAVYSEEAIQTIQIEQ